MLNELLTISAWRPISRALLPLRAGGSALDRRPGGPQLPASMSVAGISPGSSYWPTAVHALLAPHETPASRFSWVLLGSGVVAMVHAVPSHTSASVWAMPKLVRAVD